MRKGEGGEKGGGGGEDGRIPYRLSIEGLDYSDMQMACKYIWKPIFKLYQLEFMCDVGDGGGLATAIIWCLDD
jgi:hypothetical protein